MLRDLRCCDDRDGALRLIADGAAVIAGGTDFVPMYAAGDLAAERVVDINRVPEFGVLRTDRESARIGATVRLARLGELQVPGLGAIADGAALVGSAQTRARATIGGNACRASPSGDTLAGLVASGATMVIGSVSGPRQVRAGDFFLGPGRAALADGELLERIDVPVAGAASAYSRATVRRAMDLATVGVAVHLAVDGGAITGARAAVAGAGPIPILVPGMAWGPDDVPAHADVIVALGDQIHAAVAPIDDARGSAWYRRQLIRPTLQRSFDRAVARVKGTPR